MDDKNAINHSRYQIIRKVLATAEADGLITVQHQLLLSEFGLHEYVRQFHLAYLWYVLAHTLILPQVLVYFIMCATAVKIITIGEACHLFSDVAKQLMDDCKQCLQEMLASY